MYDHFYPNTSQVILGLYQVVLSLMRELFEVLLTTVASLFGLLSACDQFLIHVIVSVGLQVCRCSFQAAAHVVVSY